MTDTARQQTAASATGTAAGSAHRETVPGLTPGGPSVLPGEAPPRLFERSQNERMILSIIQRAGALPSAEIARLSGLSAQSASVITRSLEGCGLIVKGDPVRGKVGKPLTPFTLNRDGAYSLGIRIGRRSADVVLLDFCGNLRGHRRANYAFPMPDRIMDFAQTSMTALLDGLGPSAARGRVAGFGVGAPFELWKWLDGTGSPKPEMMAWKEFSFEEAFARFTDLPVLVGNDASLACSGEHAFGAATEETDFVYFYVGSFIGGGVVLDDRLHLGRKGNGGAFGSFPVKGADGVWRQLISHASVIRLEQRLEDRFPGAALAMLQGPEWTGFDDLLDAWLTETGEHVAYAAITAIAAFDVPAVVVDCGAPPEVRRRLVARVEAIVAEADCRGIDRPRILEGRLGPMAGALGAGHQPFVASLLRD